jgi:isopenicillin-N N-acyltransferase like protein
VIRVAGGPRERGLAAGRALAEPIARSLRFYRRFMERRGMEPADLPRLLRPFRAAAERALPDLVEEADGLADGAGADLWEVFAVNAFEELEPILEPPARVERCSSFVVTGPEGTVVAHNENWYAGDLGNAAVVVAEPSDGPAFASPTVVTCLPAVGMSAAGMAQGVMSLASEDDGSGIPRVLVSRSALQAVDRRDHVRRATVAGRSGGYAYVVGAAGGEAFRLETSATGFAVLDGAGGHTNHYLDPDLGARGHVSPGSVSRLERLRALLAERSPSTPEAAMDILRDHRGDPQAICLHPDPAEGDEASAVLFSMVCHLEDRRMWVAAGNPCAHPFEEIDLPEVA